MAALKLFVFALLATWAFAEDNFLDVKIEKAITNVVDEGQKSLESSIADFSGEILNSLEGILSFLQLDALSEIDDDLVQFLSDVGGDLLDIASSKKGMQECFQQSEPRIQAIVEKTREKLRECGQGSLTELEDLFNRAIEEFTKSAYRFAEIYDGAMSCGDWSCMIQFRKKFLEEILNVYVVAKHMMVEFQNLIKQTLPEVRECIATADPGLREEFQQIVDDVIKCLTEPL